MTEKRGCCGSRETGGAVFAAELIESFPEGGSKTAAGLKEFVRERYSEAATTGNGCGCGCSNASDEAVSSFVGEDYAGRPGYEPEADLGLGCGIPTDLAAITAGETVLDLGSGAGIDAFIAAERSGPDGLVFGVDFTPEMIQRARSNAARLGYANVRFLEGDIEALPIAPASIDVILSNCVLNLVPDKRLAFYEMYRVLKPGGRFVVSDIVIRGQLPESLRESMLLYAGCVSGALPIEDYLGLLSAAGFSDVEVLKERGVEVPDEILLTSATREDVDRFRYGGGIVSVTVRGFRSAD